MTHINSIATKLYFTPTEKTPSQAATSARVFSSINARSCAQRPQTCHENKASSSSENSTNIRSYLRLRYRQGLAHYKTPYISANESLFRNWLALVDNNDKWFNAEKTEVGTKLLACKAFGQGLSSGMQKIFSQSTLQLNLKEYEILSSVIQRHYLLKGNFDFHAIFMDMRDNRQQLLNQLTQSFVKVLTKNITNSSIKTRVQQQEGIKEQAATQARNVIARFYPVLDEHHDNGNLDKVQRRIEMEFLKAFNYKVVNETNLQAGKCKEDEFFVANEDGTYSIVTLNNFFEPLYEPMDPDIYQRDIIENPNRDDLSAYFKTHFGEQILTYSGRENDWERSEEKDFAKNTWKQAVENEKQTENNPKAKARINLNEIKRRDGLFSQKDALESGINLLARPLELFNTAGEYWGFNTHPHIPRKNQEYASPHHDKNAKFTYSKEWMPSSPQTIKNKPDSNDPFAFPAAKAASIVPSEKTPEERQTLEKYDDWLKEGVEKPELLNRQKRAFEEGKITVEQIIKVSFEQYLGISADPAFEHLRTILSKDLTHWAHHPDPEAELFKEIKATVQGVIVNSQSNEEQTIFMLNTLGAFEMAAIENNQDFRRSYMFYMHESEKSVSEKGTFFYHAGVEDLFPSSYQAFEQGFNYFQQIPADFKSLQNHFFNLYALLLHHQTLGKPLNYKNLAMAFALVDILNFTVEGEELMDVEKKLLSSWAKISTDTGAVLKKMPAIQKYARGSNKPLPMALFAPITTGQHIALERFITPNMYSIGGMCYYLTVSVLLDLADGRNLDAVANVREKLLDFYKLVASDPIVSFRVAQLLANANKQLFRSYGTLSNSAVPVRADRLFKRLKNNNKLVDIIFGTDQHGYNIAIQHENISHSIGVMPIKVGNQVIHYYYDPNFAIIPCFCKEQLEEAINFTYKWLEIDNKDPNVQSKTIIFTFKLTKPHLAYLKTIQTNSGLGHGVLDKQTLSRLANSHALSNEDWSAFFPDFNKGEKLYNKDFDSLEGDPVYKALKTDTSPVDLSRRYLEAFRNLPSNPINPNAISSVTIGDVLEREKLAAANQGPYHDAAQALESEVRSHQRPSNDIQPLDMIPHSPSSQDTIADRSRFSVSLEDLLVGDADRNGLAASLEDLLAGDPPLRTSTQNLGQNILNAVVDSGSPSGQNQAQANGVTSRRSGIRGLASRFRNVFTSWFGRLGRARDGLEAEFNNLAGPHLSPTTTRRFLDEILKENISEADLDAVDLETHKINQQVNQINTKIAEALQKKGLQVSDFHFSPAENVNAAGAIRLYRIDNPTEKFTIDLGEHPELSNLWQDVKTVINGRTHNFVEAMTSHLSDAQRTSMLGNGWKAVGHLSNAGSKFLSLYALTTLGDESNFFQQSHLANGEKVLNILTMSDLVLDNGANAASLANSIVKRLSTPSATLSKISRFTGKASNVVALIAQGFELGFYSYAYKHAQTTMEKEVAKVMVVSKSFQSALTVATIAACSAAPPLAPIFMMLGLFVSYVESKVLTKTISKETANMLFWQFAGELEFMRKLLENPKLLFNEEKDQITVVSANMPYSKLVVTANGIQMERNAEPFAVEFTETFRQTVEQYKRIVFREPGSHAGSLPIYDYDNMPAEYQDYKEMLQNFGRGFKQGFSLSPENDDIGEFTERHERGREHFINQELANENGTFSEEIAQRQVIVGNIAQCLTQEAENAAPTYQHTFRESNKAQNIVIQGHPVKPIYQSNGCTQGEVNGYSYAPRWDEIKNLDECSTALNGTAKSGDFWKTRRVKEVYRNTEKDAAPSLYKGKLAFKESSHMPHLKPSSIINVNQWKLETSWKAQTCYENPDRVQVEIGSPQYVLSSGGAMPYVYHFPQDEFVENLKRLHLEEDEDPQARVAGNQVYGLYSDFPISNSNVDEESSWFDITLVPDGNTFLQLYPNTYLNISEQAATETAPAKGDIHLMIPYKTLRLNGVGLGQKAITSKKVADKKELIFLPETNQPIHIRLDDSVKRTVNVDIIKELPNKTTAVCGVLVSLDEKGSLSLELNQISQVPLGNVASTTAFVNSQIQELKAAIPNLAAKNVRVHALNLSQTPYHQEKALEAAPLPLAPIWEKTLNQTLTDAGSTNKTEFVSTGWYFAQNENIKDHPAVQKSASLLVPKIWRSDLPFEVQEIVQRMVFVGFARESMVSVPEDVKSAIAHQNECFSYHFFDPQTELMIKQWGASEIRFWDSRDITQCSPNTIPQKVFWSGSETDNYTCDVVHISPPTETMGGAQGRVAIMVEGNSSKLELANTATNNKFLNYIFNKSLSGLIQRTKADPDWNPDESDIDLQNLMIHVKDIELKYQDQSTAPVQAFLLHDKEPQLALVPKGEGLLAIPKMQNYAITGAKVETFETDAKPTYKLFKRPLIKGKAYEKINEQLTKGALVIDEADLAQKSEIKPEFQFVGIKNAPLDNAIICHTAEGIAMALDYDLKNTKLLGVSNDYLASKNISLSEEMAILTEYQSLVDKVGPSAFAYINLYQSDENNPEQSSIYVNAKTAVPTLIYVPVFYYEYAQGSRVVKKQALSKELLVISDTNDVAGQTKRAVVQDVTAKKIYTVWRSDKTRPSLGDVFPYTYMIPSANGIFIGLDQHAHTPLNDVELPKINHDRLFLLPCDKQEQKRVELKDWMLKRLNTLTLAKPIHSNDYVQQILLTPSQLTAVNAIKPLITKDLWGRLQLSLLMATQNQDITKGSELIKINLENAISADGKLDPAFVDSIKLHNTTLALQQLTNEAYAEYLKILA